MPWNLILGWILFGCTSAPLAGFAFGGAVAFASGDPNMPFFLALLVGGLGSFMYAVGLALLGLPLVSALVVAWVLAVRQHPFLEGSYLRVIGSLSSVCVGVLAVVMAVLPQLESPFYLLLLTMLLSALVLPRCTPRLRPGVFAA